MRTKILLPFALGLALLSLAGCGGVTGTPGILNTPVISGITPNPVVRGATITITGSNLNGSFTTAYFSGNVQATSTASSGSTTSITVTVPTTIGAGSYSVYVITSDSTGDISSPSNSVTITLT